MATQKQIKSRIQLKHDSKANWDKATTFVPLAGELIVYDDLKRIKIGDGSTTVGQLAFVGDNIYTSKLADTIYWYYNESATQRRTLRFQSVDASFALFEESLDVDGSWRTENSLCTLSLLNQTWSGAQFILANSDIYHQMTLSNTGITFYDDDIGGTELSISGQDIILRDSDGPSITLNGRNGITFAGIGTGTITGITDASGTSSTLAASQKLVSTTVAKYLPLAGGTMTGNLTIAAGGAYKTQIKTDQIGVVGETGTGTVGLWIDANAGSPIISRVATNGQGNWTFSGITDSLGTSSTLAASQKCVKDALEGYLSTSGGYIYSGKTDRYTQLLGDRLVVFWDDNGLSSVSVNGEAVTVCGANQCHTQLTGDSLIFTDADGLNNLTITGISDTTGSSSTIAISQKGLSNALSNYVQSTDSGLNTLINKLGIGESVPGGNDYFISQYVGGGSTTVTYHRRKISTLRDYLFTQLVAGDGISITQDSSTGKIIISCSYSQYSGSATQLS